MINLGSIRCKIRTHNQSPITTTRPGLRPSDNKVLKMGFFFIYFWSFKQQNFFYNKQWWMIHLFSGTSIWTSNQSPPVTTRSRLRPSDNCSKRFCISCGISLAVTLVHLTVQLCWPFLVVFGPLLQTVKMRKSNEAAVGLLQETFWLVS